MDTIKPDLHLATTLTLLLNGFKLV